MEQLPQNVRVKDVKVKSRNREVSIYFLKRTTDILEEGGAEGERGRKKTRCEDYGASMREYHPGQEMHK